MLLINDEFAERLGDNYNAAERDLYITHDDLVKITTTMLDLNHMTANLKQQMIEHISLQLNELNYEILAELAVLYALKMDKTYRTMFFEKTRDKFLKEMQYLKDETMYKILWAFFKAKELQINDNSQDWIAVKKAIVKRSKELSPKTLSDILVLST